MDKTVLVDHDIKEGERLLRALDEAGVPVVAALWYYLPEPGVWRYTIATPLVQDPGPRKTYARIESVRAGTSPPVDISLDQMSLDSPTSHLIGELRIFAGTPGAPHIGGGWLNKSMVGEVYVETAYVYRAEQIIGKSGTMEQLFAIPHHGGRQWTLRNGKMTTRDGFIVEVTVENHNLKTSVGRRGINASFYVVTSAKYEDGKKMGTVQRITVIDGRPRTLEDIAADVEFVD
jgi:hypothetical protein